MVDPERATSFGTIAQDYDRLRPSPPPEAVDWLLPAGCGVAVDLAAGTGLLTRELEPRVQEVIAVEPDERMRAVLAARSPQVRTLEGVGEAIPLPDACADAVLVSSAWHWMDPARAVPEIARVLRDGGRVGLIWTRRDPEVDWVREIDLLRLHEPPGETAARAFRGRDVVLPPGSAFEHVTTASFAHTRPMALDDLVAMSGTYSAVITADPATRAAGLAAARAAIEARFPGAATIDVPIRAVCWRADRVPRSVRAGRS